jgi:hypothetical protein
MNSIHSFIMADNDFTNVMENTMFRVLVKLIAAIVQSLTWILEKENSKQKCKRTHSRCCECE